MEKSRDVIFILGGSLKKDENGWRTTFFNEGDNFGGLGDRLRVVAASYIHKKNPDTLFVVVGGKGRLSTIKDAPAVSEVILKELIDLGVSAKKIIQESQSENTFAGLVAIQRMIQEGNYQRVLLLSNEFHLPRIQTMIECVNQLHFLFRLLSFGMLNFLSAEKICVDNDKIEWEPIIRKAYESESMRKRLSNEARGVEDIKKGRYTFQ